MTSECITSPQAIGAKARRHDSDRAVTDPTAGLTVIALLLALLLGLSAVDIQHRKAPDGGVAASVAPVTLDGRGKWGGYL